MRVVVTGTPGAGKTSASELVETDLSVIHLNEVVEQREFYTEIDVDRDTLVADIDRLRTYLADREDVLIESHLAHHFAADRVIVLRCRPAVLERRLLDRGEPPQKAAENAESEALDVVLSEAVATHGREAVYEIDTTNRTPAETAAAIEAVLAGEREPSAGTVDYTEYL